MLITPIQSRFKTRNRTFGFRNRTPVQMCDGLRLTTSNAGGRRRLVRRVAEEGGRRWSWQRRRLRFDLSTSSWLRRRLPVARLDPSGETSRGWGRQGVTGTCVDRDAGLEWG